jgi:hypothetical protein
MDVSAVEHDEWCWIACPHRELTSLERILDERSEAPCQAAAEMAAARG